uniref:uncharacterized protein n=1 Tax=Centroberyx gerrardi TaxID=166262 RepID=UPI003AAB64DA
MEQKMERNQDGQQEPNSVCVGDDKGKGITKEAAVGLPAKKKRRMEVSITERSEAEMKLQSRHCGGKDRAETEVHVAMTTSDGTSNVCDPGYSEGESCQAGSSMLPDPGQINESETDPPAEREGRLGSHPLIGEERQEQEGSAVEIMVEKCEKQRQDGEGGSGESDSYPATGFSTKTPQSEGTEREQQEGNQAAPLQVDSVAGTRDGRVERMGGEARDGDGADAGASSTHTGPGGISCGSEELFKAAVTPSGPEGKGNCGPDDNPGTGLSPVSTEHPQTRDAPDPFGSGSLYYVSDSQLNNIVLIEEEVMEADGGLGASDCHEDATDLVCGLIRELSSLNRTVMATHRELESLRRGNKASRASMR